MKGRAGLLLTILLVAAATSTAGAYLKLGSRVGTQTITLRWPRMPVRYFVADRGTASVTSQQFQQTVTRAFSTWNAVPTASTSSEFAGFTNATPRGGDNATVLGFQNRPELDRTLAATSFLVDTTTGDILESDIFFNTAFPWSVAAGGQTNSFDLESIALHEIGHLHGLAHSAIGETELQGGGRRVIAAEAVMFPIAFSPANIQFRTLRPDDIAGISDLYPGPRFTRDTGSVSGTVTKNGKGVLGAHIVAFHLRTGRIVGGFSLSGDGSFVIAGLEPGPHILRVEPLDDADIESFLDLTLGVDVDFRPKFFERLIVAPKGGGTTRIDIKVLPKGG